MSSYIEAPAINFLPTRVTWIRTNRLLAWMLVASPFVEFFAKLPRDFSVEADVTLLLAHGALSLVLFGLPKLKGKRFHVVMHVLGFRLTGLSERNRFLLSGYRIALAMVPMLLLWLSFPAAAALAVLLLLYPLLRLPVTLIQHLYGGIDYAFKRWGWAGAAAEAVVFLYVLFSLTNLCSKV